MRKLFTLLIALFLWAGSSWGQVSGYTFSHSVGTYTSVTGGTQIIAPSIDDGSSVATAIGFDFVFNGSTFTQFVANSNGSIRLGSVAPTSAYNPISTTTNTNAIALYARDGRSGTAGVNILVTGSAPNRVLTIDYPGFFPAYGSAVNYIDMQVKLYETTNVIEIIYGSSTRATSYTAQVGLRGGTASTDFNNRTTTTNWAATTAGALSSATMTLSTTVFPVSGTTFTWTPPSLLAPGSFAATPMSSTQINVSFVPTGTPANNAVVVWNTTGTFTDPTGTPPAVGEEFAGGTLLYNGTTSPVLHTGLVFGTAYYYKAWSFSGSAYSGGVTTSASPSVAAPTALVATAISTSEIDLTWIKNSANHDVIVATNSTSTFGTPTNGSGYSVNDLITGGGSVIYIGPASGFNHTGLATATQYFYKVWSVDASNYYSSTGATANKTTLCDAISSLPWNEGFESVAIPAFPSCWYKENGDWVTTNNANATYDANAYTGTQFLRESWTASNEYIWTPGFSLDAGTSYDFSFYWAGDNYSGWVGDVFSNTSQISTGATKLGESFVVAATTTTKTYSQVLRTFIPAASGDYFFAIRVNDAVGAGWYLSFDDFKLELTPSCPVPQALSATGVYGHQATLDWTETGTATAWEVEWGASGFTPGTGTMVTNITAKPYILTGLAPSTAYAYYVRADCGGEQSAWSGPKVFTTTVSCPVPTALNSSNITTNTADINWTVNGLESAWDIIYGPAGFVAGSGIGYTEVLGTSTKPYPLTALSSGTIYDFYVRAACGVGDVSAWSAKSSFTTVCEVVTSFPHSQSFDGAFPPACWSRFTGVLAGTSTLTVTTGGWIQDDWRNVAGTDKAARDNIFSTGHYNWLVTPAFELVTDMQLEFDLSLNAYGTSNAPALTGTDDKFAVVISTDGGITWSSANTLRLWDNAGSAYVYNNINPAGERVILDLSAYTRSTVKIGFYGESTLSNADNDLMINNLVIQEPPSCAAPSTLSAVASGFQAVLGWTEVGTASAWEIEYGLAGFTPGTGTPVLNVTENPYTLTGLAPSTAYNYYVKAVCGPGLASAWSPVKAFTTTVACPQPTVLTATNISTNRADLGWTEAGTATTWNVEYGEVPWTQGAGTMVTGVTENPFNISGLSAGKTYSFYVQADCGGGYQSLWSGPKTFSTLCDVVTAPFTQDFEGTWVPACWANVAVSGTSTWAQSSAASGYGAGSKSAFANFYGQSAGNSYNLLTPSFDISGLATPTLKFNYAYATYTGGEADQMDVYYSTDNGGSWTLLLAMPGGETGILNTGGVVSASFVPTAGQWGTQELALLPGTNMIRFHAISDWGNNLYLDNVQVYSPMAHDVAAISIDLNPVVPLSVVTPLASVKNEGINAETFDVTLAIGTYTSTKTVTALAAGATSQVTFDPWTNVEGNFTATLTTALTGDMNPANNTTSKALMVKNLNKVVYGYNAYPGATGTDPEGPTSFSLSTPGVLNSIADQSTLNFVAGGTWANGLWYGNVSTDNTLITIDPATGARTLIGSLGLGLNGISYNVVNGIMYGVSATGLYTINTTTGLATLVGTNTGINMVNFAINAAGVAYSIDLTNDVLGTVNLTTGLFTAIGSIGFDANYAQDMEFDRETGDLFVAAQDPTSGWLALADLTTGNTLKIGDFEGGAEITGFGIPYTSVTFQVNMNQQTVSPNGVHLAGVFQGWNPGSTLMTDPDADGIYSVTLALAPGTYQYKYVNGNAWGSDESVPGACNVDGNRQVVITTNVILDPVCFGSCVNCINQIPLTLTVDMANQTVSPFGVHVAGSFQGWNPGSTEMIQIPSTTMYEVMVYVDENSTYTYKFVNGNAWGMDELVPIACGVDDGSGNINRSVSVSTGMFAADVVCFGECGLCATDKTLSIKVLLQGLMAPRDLGSGPETPPVGTMYEAMDGNTGLPQFDYGIADAVTVELYEGAPGFALVTQFADVQVNTDGTADITVGSGFAGDYYIRIAPRTHIAVWSASTVSFAGTTIGYDFTDNFTKAYQYPGGDLEPMMEMTPGVYALYLGDQDKNTYIDIDDMSMLVPDVVNGTVGYVDSDIDGAGWVDIDDMGLLEPNVVFGQYEQNPTFGKGMQRHLRRSR